jgi:tetratricopeptide (TPR) repeat protein
MTRPQTSRKPSAVPAAEIASMLQQALGFHRAGLLPEAGQLYRQILQARPGHFDALHLLGCLHQQRGESIAALRQIDAALKINPRAAAAHNNRGLALKDLDRFEEALASYDKAIALQPDSAESFYNRGIVLKQLHRLEEAVASYDQAIALRPGYAEAFNNRGSALKELGRHDEAVASCDRAIALKPNFAEAFNNRGAALAELERFGEALVSYRQAVLLKPDYALALYNAGNALAKQTLPTEALACYDDAIALQPDLLEAHQRRADTLMHLDRYEEALAGYDCVLADEAERVDVLISRAGALDKLGRWDEALASLDRALAIDPTNLPALAARAIELRQLGRVTEALATSELALSLDPIHVPALGARADTLVDLERFEEAVASYDAAIALNPDVAEPKLNKSLVCLSLGRFADGWALYEHRWAGARGLIPRPYYQPRWNGERLDGTLLVWGEQGLGDEILYASMVPDLLARTQPVVFEVEPRLAPLFARSFPDLTVIARKPELYGGRVDAQVALGDIGRHFRTGWASFPRRARGYLLADPERSGALRARLADGRKVIGLSWISRAPIGGESKSARLRDFEGLLRMPNCRFIDLQYGDTQAERESLRDELGIEVERLTDIDNTNDIDGLAALMSACDAVVTVSNTTAHLAGALGRPAWVMVPYGHARIWYWFRDCEESPWYPCARVCRQRGGTSWRDLVDTASNDLFAHLRQIQPAY